MAHVKSVEAEMDTKDLLKVHAVNIPRRYLQKPADVSAAFPKRL